MEPTPNEQPTSDMPAPGGEGGTTDRFREFLRTPSDCAAGEQIGQYRLVSLIGEGGFGEVWIAERREPFVQRVALKVVKAGMDSKSVVARFEQERQALAVMNHPNIAKVLDGGLTPQGRPYFAMEFVKGEPITEFCDARKLSVKQRLELFAQACEAIQHAHLKGIVHRDIKPSNILAFAVEGAAPRLKVIDFGVAKAMSQPLTDKTIFTETGQMIGTPAYMSPEQADPSAGDIDTRSDIYSLGVLLYELVTGATPFDAKTLRAKAYGEIQRIIREDDPPTPSARLSTISTKDAELASRIEKARGIALRDLTRELKSELEWIPLKAMRKEPEGRYQTAIALADDVRAYLDGQPITAAPESAGYRIRKYVRRHRGPVIAATLIGGALLAGIAGTTWKWREAEEAKSDERKARESAELERSSAEAARAVAVVNEAAAVSARARLDRVLGAIAADTAVQAAQVGDYQRLWSEIGILLDLGQKGRFEAQLAVALADQSAWRSPSDWDGEILDIHFGSDESKVLCTTDRMRLRTLDTTSGDALGDLDLKPRATQPSNHRWRVACVSPDAKYLAAWGKDRGTIAFWDLGTGQVAAESPSGAALSIECLAFSPDGKVLASGEGDGKIRFWDATTGSELGGPLFRFGAGFSSIRFSPDGQMIASGGTDKIVRLWSVASRAQVGADFTGHGGSVVCVAFSPSGKTLVSGSVDGTLRLWNVASGRALGKPLEGHDGAVRQVVFSHDGRFLASGGADKTIRLWSVVTGKSLGEPLRGHEAAVNRLVFHPSDRGLVSSGVDRVVRFWGPDALDQPLDLSRHHDQPVTSIAFSPDSRVIASGSRDKSIRLWDVPTGLQIGLPLTGHEYAVTSVAFSFDGTSLASSSEDGTVRLWDLANGRPIGEPLGGMKHPFVGVAFTPDGEVLLGARSDSVVERWDIARGRALGELMFEDDARVPAIAFSPNGRCIAHGLYSNVQVFSVSDGAPLGKRLDGKSSVSTLRFGTDSKLLACGGDDGEIRVWDTESQRLVSRVLMGHDGPVRQIAFGPYGTILASSGKDGTVRLWETVTGRAIGRPFSHHQTEASSVAFSPDGSLLASGGEDGAVRFLHAVPVRERANQAKGRLAEIASVQSELAAEFTDFARTPEAIAKFEERIRVDPRFTGSLRNIALIALANLTAERPKALDTQLDLIELARLEDDWERLLALLSEVQLDELDNVSEWLLDEAAWRGLTQFRRGSPVRDLRRLLEYAENAVVRSGRDDGSLLSTLALAHWESGDKDRAIAVQREAIEVSRRNAEPEDQAKADDFVLSLEATLDRYETQDPPSAVPQTEEP